MLIGIEPLACLHRPWRVPTPQTMTFASGQQRIEVIPMKLYYSPGACSLADHIALQEADMKVDLVKVDLKTHKLENCLLYTSPSPRDRS